MLTEVYVTEQRSVSITPADMCKLFGLPEGFHLESLYANGYRTDPNELMGVTIRVTSGNVHFTFKKCVHSSK